MTGNDLLNHFLKKDSGKSEKDRKLGESRAGVRQREHTLNPNSASENFLEKSTKDKQKMTGNDLLKSGIVGLMKDRKDITDSVAYAKDLGDKVFDNNLSEKSISEKVLEDKTIKEQIKECIPDDECNYHLRDTHWLPDILGVMAKRESLANYSKRLLRSIGYGLT
jgi:hypothetical protein